MLEGTYVEGVMMHPRVRAYPIQPQEMSGATAESQAIYRYSLKNSDYPTLILADAIYDGNGEFIAPGYYELALSDTHEFLILLQSRNPRALIPVFKIEEDLKEQERLNDKKYKKQLKKEAKERAEINAKRAKVGMPPDLPYIHMEATVEYVKDGDYYLIKYQRGTLRAWGAFKG